jgi:hypothetical protein
MRVVPILALAFTIGVLAGTPTFALTYEGWPPPGGDCGAIAAQRGAGATWYGEFAGRHYDSFREMYFPISARGCFVSEYECRRWQNEAMSFAGQGGMLYARCTQGAPDY